jgi:hypothetical protein
MNLSGLINTQHAPPQQHIKKRRILTSSTEIPVQATATTIKREKGVLVTNENTSPNKEKGNIVHNNEFPVLMQTTSSHNNNNNNNNNALSNENRDMAVEHDEVISFDFRILLFLSSLIDKDTDKIKEKLSSRKRKLSKNTGEE